MTAEIELDREARPTRTRFYRSRIRSDARLDYDQLDRVFDGREEPPAAAAEPLAAARDAAAALGEHRGATEPRSNRPSRVRGSMPTDVIVAAHRSAADRGPPPDRAADDP